MEDTEDFCGAFFDGDRWFPHGLCGLCFSLRAGSVVVKASGVILALVFGINPDRKPKRPHFSGVDGLAFSW
jgi:hypothetical protein